MLRPSRPDKSGSGESRSNKHQPVLTLKLQRHACDPTVRDTHGSFHIIRFKNLRKIDKRMTSCFKTNVKISGRDIRIELHRLKLEFPINGDLLHLRTLFLQRTNDHSQLAAFLIALVLLS